MTHLIAGNDHDNRVREINCDDYGNLITIDFWHDQVHEGEAFTVNYLEPAVANNASVQLRGLTGTKELHLVIEFSNGGDGTFKTYTGTTYSAAGTLADGTKLSVFNRKGSSTIPLETVFRYAPTVNVLGTARGLRAIQGGKGGNSTGGSATNGIETNVPPNTDFLMVVTNLSGQTKIADIVIDCYEI